MHKLFFLFLLVHGQIIILFSLPMQCIGHGGSICLTYFEGFCLDYFIFIFLFIYLFTYLLDINRKEKKIEPRQETKSTTQPRDFVLFLASEK
jgi:hypothetical protein